MITVTTIRRAVCAAFVLASAIVHSVQAQVFVGYCPDQISSSGLSNINSPVSCAAAFTGQGLLSLYQDCDLGALNIGLSSTQGLTSFRVWVREHLNADNLVECQVPVDSLVTGWNTITLPQSVAIAGHDTLYCGYDYTHDQQSVHVISYAGAKKTKLSFWLGVNGQWGDYTSSRGPVSIRAGIVGQAANTVRLSNLRLNRRSQPFSAEPSQYDSITVSGTLQCLGSQPLRSFSLVVTDNDSVTPDTLTFSDFEALQFGQTLQFAYSLRPGVGVTAPCHDVPLSTLVLKPNGDADAHVIDGHALLYYDLYDAQTTSQPAVNIIEEFTSERCGFAPLGQQRLRQALDAVWPQQSDAPRYVILSHHEGFGPADAWRVTQGSDYDAALFGPQRLSFAPAALVNRQGQPFSTTLPVDSLQQLLLSSPQASQYVSIQAQAQCQQGLVTATVTVCPQALTFCQNPQLVLCLVQPQVASVQPRNYYPDAADATWQRDVIRCYLHSTTGSDALFPSADMSALMSGQLRVADAMSATVGQELTFQYQGHLPADVSSLQGLVLVAYVYDKGYTHRIFGSYSLSY